MMGRRVGLSAALILCIFATFAFACLVAMSSMPLDNCLCDDKFPEPQIFRNTHFSDAKHKLAVLVPFRDRFDELLVFANHMDEFLRNQKIAYHIFVINQSDRYRFNRASLINVGFMLVKSDFDYIVMHDVDLLPLNLNLSYAYPRDGPFHVASPEYHPRYNYSTFVGGILLINREHFEMVDGMSNKYWGWGLEDDEFYVRLKEAQLKVSRPVNLSTDRTNTFTHNHDRAHRRRDTVKCYNQYEATRRRDRDTGLHNVDYEKINEHRLVIDNVSLTVFNINLICDKSFTPWCECLQQPNPNNLKKSKGKL